MSAAQLLRQADALKSAVADKTKAANEVWTSRQSLQDIYQKLLVIDLEYALDKKVEQDLWNHAFKNQISTLQNQVKDKQNAKRGEVQSSLNLFLETASGFYLQLIQQLCSAFSLNLPFRRKSSCLAIIKEYGPVAEKIHVPEKSSCMYVCQHCLVHLGDIARYRQQVEQAQTYYRHAANLVPYNGQPYNQLAILEAAKGNKLSTVFYYVRSIAVKHPFPVAITNLEKFYDKISREKMDFKGKLSVGEIVSTFLQLQAFIHLCTDLSVAESLVDRIVSSLPAHITSVSFSSFQLIQIVAINLFSLHHTKKRLGNSISQSEDKENKVKVSKNQSEKRNKVTDEKLAYQIAFKLNVSILDTLLHYTPKQESKARDYHTLPVIKLLADWLRINPDALSDPAFTTSSIWSNLSKLVNNLQFPTSNKDVPKQLEKYASTPLTEDSVLQTFIPIQKAHSDLDFSLAAVDDLSSDLEMRLRCHRILEHALWICDQFPSLNLLNVQHLRSARLQFSAPSSHIRTLTGVDRDPGTERKTSRQNVAIQAIMQNKAKRTEQAVNSGKKPEDVIMASSPGKNLGLKQHGLSDASCMPHTNSNPLHPNSASYHQPAVATFPPNNKPITIKIRPQQPDSDSARINSQNDKPKGYMANERTFPDQKPYLVSPAPGASTAPIKPTIPNKDMTEETKSPSFPSNLNLGPIGVFARPTQHGGFTADKVEKSPASQLLPNFDFPNTAFPPPYFAQDAQDPSSFPNTKKPQEDAPPKLISDFPNLHIPLQAELEDQFNFQKNPQHFIPPTPNSDQLPADLASLNSEPRPSELHPIFTTPRLTPGVLPANQRPVFPGAPPMPRPPTQGTNQMTSEQAQAILNQLFSQATLDQQPQTNSTFGQHYNSQDLTKSDRLPTNSLFGGSGPSVSTDQQGANTYSLFSQSPWLPKVDSVGPGSSPFSSASSSQSVTPDPYTHHPPANNPPPHHTTGGWKEPQSRGDHHDDQQLPSNNIQSLFSSGPSPLEKLLLEQQKHHRHGDPPH